MDGTELASVLCHLYSSLYFISCLNYLACKFLGLHNRKPGNTCLQEVLVHFWISVLKWWSITQYLTFSYAYRLAADRSSQDAKVWHWFFLFSWLLCGVESFQSCWTQSLVGNRYIGLAQNLCRTQRSDSSFRTGYGWRIVEEAWRCCKLKSTRRPRKILLPDAANILSLGFPWWSQERWCLAPNGRDVLANAPLTSRQGLSSKWGQLFEVRSGPSDRMFPAEPVACIVRFRITEYRCQTWSRTNLFILD